MHEIRTEHRTGATNACMAMQVNTVSGSERAIEALVNLDHRLARVRDRMIANRFAYVHHGEVARRFRTRQERLVRRELAGFGEIDETGDAGAEQLVQSKQRIGARGRGRDIPRPAVVRARPSRCSAAVALALSRRQIHPRES